ncbi:L-fuconolactonase [Bryocella elongata]|uniref:L-fuconolactonase n=1 Tax=Bryocella elongata TaxID=863522 RepID=A0A1H6B3S9_9BACT|nr:amidohydrolase family protein [Bryocella elongata]SEG55250.1 L-fuconolactonase [Bryocella elongata]
MTIDAHHHLWRYTQAEYGWIDDSMAVLRRDFLPTDLDHELAAANIDGAVAVQARQTLKETRWLLDLARTCPAMRGVVGWLPLADSHIEALLDAFIDDPKLKGLRHVVQAEPAGFLDDPAFNRGISALASHSLVYDILIFERQLEETIRFVDRHPKQSFVLDHIAKPRIAAAELEPWRANVLELAKRENVTCKISGLVTEADWATWTPDSLQPYLDTVLEAFGPSRLMAGSDWPVCLVASSYTRWWDTLRNYCAGLSETEQAAIFGETATRIYNL